MDIKQLETLMIERGLVIKAIPNVINETVEVRHKDKYPDGIIEYDERFKRDMLKIKIYPKNRGKFLVRGNCGTSGSVNFAHGDKHYDSIEEIYDDLIKGASK